MVLICFSSSSFDIIVTILRVNFKRSPGIPVHSLGNRPKEQLEDAGKPSPLKTPSLYLANFCKQVCGVPDLLAVLEAPGFMEVPELP